MQHNSFYQLKIVNTEIVSDVVYYQIQVLNTNTKVSWSFRERYKNMLTLHQQLTSQLKRDLPQFPAKKMFGNTDPEFISTRKAGLQNYFKTLLSLIDADQQEVLKKFLTQGDPKMVKEKEEHHQQQQQPQLTQTNNTNQLQKQKQQDMQQQKNALKQKLQQACEKAKNNFIDLNSMMNAPEEVEIKKKRIVYDQVKTPQMNNLIDLPKSAPSAKMSIAEPTIDFKYPALTELMEQLQKEIDRIITIVD